MQKKPKASIRDELGFGGAFIVYTPYMYTSKSSKKTSLKNNLFEKSTKLLKIKYQLSLDS